jgi:hypothetical protein
MESAAKQSSALGISPNVSGFRDSYRETFTSGIVSLWEPDRRVLLLFRQVFEQRTTESMSMFVIAGPSSNL